MGPDVRYGLLHGRLSAEEKTAALCAFASGETNVLIATTVVEASPCPKHSTVPSHCTMVQCPSRAQSLVCPSWCAAQNSTSTTTIMQQPGHANPNL
jgi:superfamily II DNA/RNA helicase